MTHTITARIQLPDTSWLALNDGTYFSVIKWAPGGRSFRKRTVEGTYTKGRTVIGMVRDTEQSTLVVKVSGATEAAQAVNATSLFDAFSQFATTFEITINGVTTSLAIEAADQIVNAKGEWDKHSAARSMPCQTYSVTFSHEPA